MTSNEATTGTATNSTTAPPANSTTNTETETTTINTETETTTTTTFNKSQKTIAFSTSSTNTKSNTTSTTSTAKLGRRRKQKEEKGQKKRLKLDMGLFQDYVNLLGDNEMVPNKGGLDCTKKELLEKASLGHYFVELIIQDRESEEGGKEYLVSWVGCKDMTWEKAESIPESEIEYYNCSKE